MPHEYPDARRYMDSTRFRSGDPNKTHKASLVIIPPRELAEPIQGIRKVHDRKIGRWMPHINIIYPFRPRRMFGEASNLIEEACAGIAPFEISLASFHSFDHGTSHTMWLDPEPNAPLVDLHDRLLERFPDCDEVRKFATGFRPHLSVGQAKTAEDVEKLLQEFAASWKPITFTVDSVALIWRSRQTQDIFKIDRRIQLGEHCSSDEAVDE
jgi:2'-5' RNA ligase